MCASMYSWLYVISNTLLISLAISQLNKANSPGNLILYAQLSWRNIQSRMLRTMELKYKETVRAVQSLKPLPRERGVGLEYSYYLIHHLVLVLFSSIPVFHFCSWMPWPIADFKQFHAECELASLISNIYANTFVSYLLFIFISNQVPNCSASRIAGCLDFNCMKFRQKWLSKPQRKNNNLQVQVKRCWDLHNGYILTLLLFYRGNSACAQ